MFRVLWLATKDLFDELFLLMGVNVLWVLINLPLLGFTYLSLMINASGPAILGALLAALTLGPTNAGLYAVAERVYEGRATKLGTFFSGMRQYWRLSWQVYGVWMLGLVLIVSSLVFYSQLNSIGGQFLLVLFVYLLALWLALLIYIGPLMLLQTDKRLRVIARNAVFMAMGRPLFTLVTALLMAVILVLSALVLLPLWVITVAFLGLWGFRATSQVIKEAQERQEELARKAAEAAGAARLNADKGRGGQVRPRE